MVQAAILGAGAFMQMLGNYSANLAQAQAEKESAVFLEKQAKVAELMQTRKLEQVKRKYATTYGQQVTSFAKGNVDIGTGSASDIATTTLADSILELQAVKEDTDLQIELARVRGIRSQEKAAMLESPGYNLLQAGSTALGAYAKTV